MTLKTRTQIDVEYREHEADGFVEILHPIVSQQLLQTDRTLTNHDLTRDCLQIRGHHKND